MGESLFPWNSLAVHNLFSKENYSFQRNFQISAMWNNFMSKSYSSLNSQFRRPSFCLLQRLALISSNSELPCHFISASLVILTTVGLVLETLVLSSVSTSGAEGTYPPSCWHMGAQEMLAGYILS